MLGTGMGYRDDREALIAERDALRRDLEERTAELEALKAEDAVEDEFARVCEVATEEKALSGEDITAKAPKPRKRALGWSSVAIVIGSLAVGFAVSYYDATREDDSRITEQRTAPQEHGDPGRSGVRVRPSLQSCVPEDSRETFHVRAVISDAGVVTSAVVRSTSLGPLVEDTPASICVEAAVLGQTLPCAS
jgi:hypothetical protein